jgi:hypothetical protein
VTSIKVKDKSLNLTSLPTLVTPVPVGSISTTRHSPSDERTIHQFAKAELEKATEKAAINSSLHDMSDPNSLWLRNRDRSLFGQ